MRSSTAVHPSPMSRQQQQQQQQQRQQQQQHQSLGSGGAGGGGNRHRIVPHHNHPTTRPSLPNGTSGASPYPASSSSPLSRGTGRHRNVQINANANISSSPLPSLLAPDDLMSQETERDNVGVGGLPSEAQLVLLCLDYLRELRRAYHTRRDLEDAEGLDGRWITVAAYALSRAFVRPAQLWHFDKEKEGGGDGRHDKEGGDDHVGRKHGGGKVVDDVDVDDDHDKGKDNAVVGRGNDAWFDPEINMGYLLDRELATKWRKGRHSTFQGGGNGGFGFGFGNVDANGWVDFGGAATDKTRDPISADMFLPSLEVMEQEILYLVDPHRDRRGGGGGGSQNISDGGGGGGAATVSSPMTTTTTNTTPPPSSSSPDRDPTLWYEYDDMHPSNSHRFYHLNGLAGGSGGLSEAGAPASSSSSSALGLHALAAHRGPLSLGEIAAAGLAGLGARSRLDAEREMVRTPLFEQFLRAVEGKGFFDDIASITEQEEGDDDDDDDRDGRGAKNGGKKGDEAAAAAAARRKKRRAKALYEERYRKVVGKFRTKLAAKAAQQALYSTPGGLAVGSPVVSPRGGGVNGGGLGVEWSDAASVVSNGDASSVLSGSVLAVSAAERQRKRRAKRVAKAHSQMTSKGGGERLREEDGDGGDGGDGGWGMPPYSSSSSSAWGKMDRAGNAPMGTAATEARADKGRPTPPGRGDVPPAAAFAPLPEPRMQIGRVPSAEATPPSSNRSVVSGTEPADAPAEGTMTTAPLPPSTPPPAPRSSIRPPSGGPTAAAASPASGKGGVGSASPGGGKGGAGSASPGSGKGGAGSASASAASAFVSAPTLAPPPAEYNPVDLDEAERLKTAGNALMQKKEYDRAVESYTAALKLVPSGPTSHVYYSNRAAALLSLQRFDDALLDAERALALKPDYAKAHARRGLSNFLLGHYAEATEAYENALRLEPDNKAHRGYLEKARKKRRAQIREKREKELQSEAGLSEQRRIMAAKAERDRHRAKVEEGARAEEAGGGAFRRRSSASSKDRAGMGSERQGQEQTQKGRGGFAFDAFGTNHAPQEQRDFFAVGDNAGAPIADEDEESDGTEPLLGATRRNEDEPEKDDDGHGDGGDHSAENHEEDEEQIRRNIREADRLKARGNGKMSNKDYAGAVECYTAALNLSPAGPSSHVYFSNRAAALCYMERYEEAELDSERSLALRPDYGKAHARLGLSRFFLGDFAGAVEAYENALRHDPDNAAGKSYLEKARRKLEAMENGRAADASTVFSSSVADSYTTEGGGSALGASAQAQEGTKASTSYRARFGKVAEGGGDGDAGAIEVSLEEGSVAGHGQRSRR